MKIVLVYKEGSSNRDFYIVVFCECGSDPLFGPLLFSQMI